MFFQSRKALALVGDSVSQMSHPSHDQTFKHIKTTINLLKVIGILDSTQHPLPTGILGIYTCFNKALLKGRSSDGFLVAPTIPNAAAIATAVFYGASAAMAAASAQAGQANLKQGEPQWQQRRQLKQVASKLQQMKTFERVDSHRYCIPYIIHEYTVTTNMYPEFFHLYNGRYVWDTKNPW